MAWENAVINGEFEELNEIINGGIYQQMVYGEFDRFFLFGYADIVKFDTQQLYFITAGG